MSPKGRPAVACDGQAICCEIRGQDTVSGPFLFETAEVGRAELVEGSAELALELERLATGQAQELDLHPVAAGEVLELGHRPGGGADDDPALRLAEVDSVKPQLRRWSQRGA